jgi:hypothetical protein
MQIVENEGPPPEEQVPIVCREAAGLVHTILHDHYRLPMSEVERVEAELVAWFERFCRRPEAPPPFESRHTLLVMACVFGRSAQSQRISRGETAPDDRLERVLAREPSEVAREASRPLRLLYRKLHEE